MTSLLHALESLPAGPLYVLIALLAAVENVFPPVPADTAVALGAFLAGRGTLSAWAVFLVTLAANGASAAGVYAVGRSYGRPFFQGGLGGRLLSPAVLGHVEAAYRRFGTGGIFFSRLLPVWRALVPPFAGVAGLPPLRALPPILAATALWYGAITYAGRTLGTNFDGVLVALTRMNRALAIAAAVAAVGFGFWIYRRLAAEET